MLHIRTNIKIKCVKIASIFRSFNKYIYISKRIFKSQILLLDFEIGDKTYLPECLKILKHSINYQ